MAKQLLKDDPPMSIRFHHSQRAWLEREAAKEDRPVGWIVRNLVDTAMKKAAPEGASTRTRRNIAAE